MKAAASESFGYNEDQIVSSDIVGMRYGSLFDATQTMVAPDWQMIYMRFRLFLGMIMRTPTPARWLEQSNTSLNWLNFEIRISK